MPYGNVSDMNAGHTPGGGIEVVSEAQPKVKEEDHGGSVRIYNAGKS